MNIECYQNHIVRMMDVNLKDKIEGICIGLATASYYRGQAFLTGNRDKFNKYDWEVDRCIDRLTKVFNGSSPGEKTEI